jgi:Ca2+/Na+ antiporter
MNKACCLPIKSFFKAPFSSPKCQLRLFYLVLRTLRVLLLVIIFAIYITITLSLGTALGGILTVPCYVIYLIVLCRIKTYWKKRTLISKNDLTQPLLLGTQEIKDDA